MLDRMREKYSEPERQARLIRYFYWISTLFMLLGFAVIIYIVFF